MELYVSRERAEREARKLCERDKIRPLRIETAMKTVRRPDRQIDVGWTAAIVQANRPRVFA